MTTFAVITPTVGTTYLRTCIESLKNQNCTHHLFVDGAQHIDRVGNIANQYGGKNLRLNILDENVGKAGGDFYGHRVYAAASFLVNQDVLCYMDEDNWATPNYIEAFERTLHNHQWAFTLRDIYNKEEQFLCPDNCESLGQWPIYGDEQHGHHIDTSCFAVPREIAIQVGRAWYGQYAADRQFFHNLRHHFPKFACTKKHTVCYRLDGNPKSVKVEFFERGNAIIHEKYGDTEYPWHDTILRINTL